MSDKSEEIAKSRQVELAISELDSLPTLPSVNIKLLQLLSEKQFRPSMLAEIIESDPALAAKTLRLVNQQGMTFPEAILPLRQLLDKLPAELVVNELFSADISDYSASQTNDTENILSKSSFALHNLAVACAAGNIAKSLPEPLDYQLAYISGLLHDIGKLALDKAMPKSFARIVSEAKSEQMPFYKIEQKYLGLDHAVIGKRLGQKWNFPEPVVLAIWLHHSNTEIISQNIPGTKIAQVVQLADLIARNSDIGDSGNYDNPGSPKQIAESLGLKNEQLQKITKELPEMAQQKFRNLGLNILDTPEVYYKIARKTATQLAIDKTKLSLENQKLKTDSSHFDFIKELLGNLKPGWSLMDITESFALAWQKFYQTGPVCCYLTIASESKQLPAVVVESPLSIKKTFLNPPSESPPIPPEIADEFQILNAHDHLDWLLEQIDTEFAVESTKLLPLLSQKKAIGAIVFEIRYPKDIELFKEKFKAAASITAAILNLAGTSDSRQRFAEKFAQILTEAKTPKPYQPQELPLIIALAEMASGAAHELNNPLSVISGRAQMLADAEDEEQKKNILKQIQENTEKISQIIQDLMSFAEPSQPRAAKTDIKQVLDEATELAAQRAGIDKLDIQTNLAEDAGQVFIDSAQIVSSIAHIFSNALESYPDQSGPIEVSAQTDSSGDFVTFNITDRGCGMDAQTLQKAAQPFFSAKPAGRKRGMGLAYAARLIQLNNGTIEMESKPESGTTVTITLPTE